ncbi:unnamed protein product [Pleuronectes platessa]|uniref:Uncharacterized protein n=1 Tax=Pleuronectes platessa TaxID=8262 RepID=A0A9N7YHJ8_PLEPL|nr:unnamed protein product [Pleuronectes platessa]
MHQRLGEKLRHGRPHTTGLLVQERSRSHEYSARRGQSARYIDRDGSDRASVEVELCEAIDALLCGTCVAEHTIESVSTQGDQATEPLPEPRTVQESVETCSDTLVHTLEVATTDEKGNRSA